MTSTGFSESFRYISTSGTTKKQPEEIQKEPSAS